MSFKGTTAICIGRKQLWQPARNEPSRTRDCDRAPARDRDFDYDYEHERE
jgi:hypothetical protein